LGRSRFLFLIFGRKFPKEKTQNVAFRLKKSFPGNGTPGINTGFHFDDIQAH